MTDQKKHLTVNTDWQTAILMFVAIILSIFFGGRSSWAALVGKSPVSSASWETFFLVAALISVLIQIPDRMLKFAFGLLLFEPLMKIATWRFRISQEATATNYLIGRWVSVAACLVFCIYGINWFRERITYARS